MISLSPSDVSPAERSYSAGHAALGAFALAPGLVHLNHGSFGAVPRSVTAEQDRLRALLESDPTGFFQNEYPSRIRAAAAIAAQLFGGAPSQWVFCENATAAVNAVLASLPLQPGDELVTTSHAYGAVLKAMRIWASRKSAQVRIAEVPAILGHETQVIAAVTAAFTPRTKLLVIDHITSHTAAVFPVSEIVRLAHVAGIPVLIDGAHAPGHIPLAVTAIGADWYTGNAHKWFFAPRGCGLLWTAPHWQEITRPAVLSHGSEQDYAAAFDWIGTRDMTPWLSLSGAAWAWQMFGGEGLMSRNRALAAEGGAIVAARTGGALAAPDALRGAMAAIRLPKHANWTGALELRAMLRGRGFVVAANEVDGETFLRISAQVYNELSDYERLADALPV